MSSLQEVINFFRSYGTVPQVGMVAAFLLFLVCAVFGRRTTDSPDANQAGGQISGQVALDGQGDAHSIQVTVSPSDGKLEMKPPGTYHFTGLKNNHAYSVSFLNRGYHPKELPNILATEDGSFHPPDVVLVRDTEFGWVRRNAAPTAYPIMRGAEASAKEIVIWPESEPTQLVSTLNEGVGWKVISTLPMRVYSLIRTHTGILLAAGKKWLPDGNVRSIMRSEDGGLSWTDVPPGLDIRSVLALVETRAGRIVGTAQRTGGEQLHAAIILSEDQGKTWKVGEDIQEYDYAKGLTLTGDGHLFCAGHMEGQGRPPMIYASKDNGESWHACSTPPLSNLASIEAFASNEKGVLFCAAIHPGNDEMAPAIYRSDSAGQYWRLAGLVPAQTYALSLISSPSDGLLYVSTDKGLLKSVDEGEHWQIEFQPENASKVVTAMQLRSGKLLVFCNYSSSDPPTDPNPQTDLWFSTTAR